MKPSTTATLLILLIAGLISCVGKREISICYPAGTEKQVRMAAEELAAYLTRMYSGTSFELQEGLADTGGHAIFISTENRLREMEEIVTGKLLQEPEAFAVFRSDHRGYIVGRDAKGVFNGVYALLEHLGCSFYLSHESVPEYEDALNFELWDLADAPEFGDRMVFNWHNFLSGCTGWDYVHWKKWIHNAAKMRYSGIMVHAYGNNPMYSFSYNGERKPVGYLTTTRNGRDWGAQHVNDVQRLYGGFVFDGPVLGSEAALVPEHERSAAATALMQQVFRYAEDVEMEVNFAVDVDTWPANPQNVIATLPAEARFVKRLEAQKGLFSRGTDFYFANPDTEEGYAYYRAQMQSIMETYPEIDMITVWARRFSNDEGWNPVWRSLNVDDFPGGWLPEYQQLLKEYPDLRSDVYAPSTFAISKIVVAFQRAAEELGYNVEIATGSWDYAFLNAAEKIYPDDVPLIPLDWSVVFYEDSVRQALASIGKEHPLIPVVWAHHDDHRYIGKPYTPFVDFADKLDQTHSRGFGIIHWTTRPLDLYFKSLIRQTWKTSRNEALTSTIDTYVSTVLAGSGSTGQGYMSDWVHNAPMFGRETLDYFLDPRRFILGEKPAPPGVFLEGCKKRLSMLKEVPREGMPPEVVDMVEYYSWMEEFFINLISAHQQLTIAYDSWTLGRSDEARAIMEDLRPEKAIVQYAEHIMHGGATRGEQALVSTLNLQWLPDFINMRQVLRLEPVRYNFQPTSHDILAQAPGHYTYYFSPEQVVWLGLGEKEIPGTAAMWGGDSVHYTIEETYIASQSPFDIALRSFRGMALPAGEYALTLIFAVKTYAELDMQIESGGAAIQRFSIPSHATRYDVDLHLGDAGATLQIDPRGVEVALAGLVLQPAE